MRFFPPKDQVVFKSDLSAEEVLKRLQNNVEAQKTFGFRINTSYSTPYIGKIVGNTFSIRRVISYRNSFLPVIKGEVTSAMSGSRIKVTMQPDAAVKVFMIIWLAGVTFGCIAILTTLFTEEADFFILIPFFMLAMGLALFHFPFKIEANRSRKDFLEMLEAKIESR
ncbi:hypothetical protein [Flavobacterium sp.]|uniref:hypothetical protein n=1 Tax=Flavobacterium sp. TaxID=239 RepID=UPI00120699CD|nr:hypothetical protein [Flavobacterium sp.]RZJ69929.1 MAG: hypothetical protein EOO49_15975 [Flavobacterium sp.]